MPIFRFPIRYLTCGFALSAWLLSSCASTQITSLQKDPVFNAKDMRRVLVIAVVNKPSTRRLLESEFVKELKEHGSEGVASYTLVREGEKMDVPAWKKVVSDQKFDSVIVSRLVDIEVVHKDVASQNIKTPNATGNYGGNGFDTMSYGYVYQPGFSVSKGTAVTETEVYYAAQEKPMWSAYSKTDIDQDNDPEPQVRSFVRHMMDQIYH